MFLSSCANETSVRGESDALKALLAGFETQFREEHAARVDAITAQTESTKVQTAPLGALCNDVNAMNKTVDELCSHTSRLGNIESDFAASPALSRPWRIRQTLFRPSSHV